MTWMGNYESRVCPWCGRRISKTNCRKHGAVCRPRALVVMLAAFGVEPEQMAAWGGEKESA